MWSIWEIVFEMRMALEGGDRKKKKKQKAGSIAKERWKKRYRVEKKNVVFHWQPCLGSDELKELSSLTL